MATDKQIKKWVSTIKRNPDKLAADKLISHYLDEMFGYVFNRVETREIAKDITQEIFISMLESIKNYDEVKSAFRTWLYSIASRRIIDYYRKKETLDEPPIDISELDLSEKEGTITNIDHIIELQEIKIFIDNLEQERRDIFKLKIIEGHTFAEISKAMGLPLSTVKSNFYATQRLIRNEFRQGSA